ncbi:hypothetical protein SARC_12421, partial [Sphaeroforma arctica JP610]
ISQPNGHDGSRDMDSHSHSAHTQLANIKRYDSSVYRDGNASISNSQSSPGTDFTAAQLLPEEEKEPLRTLTSGISMDTGDKSTTGDVRSRTDLTDAEGLLSSKSKEDSSGFSLEPATGDTSIENSAANGLELSPGQDGDEPEPAPAPAPEMENGTGPENGTGATAEETSAKLTNGVAVGKDRADTNTNKAMAGETAGANDPGGVNGQGAGNEAHGENAGDVEEGKSVAKQRVLDGSEAGVVGEKAHKETNVAENGVNVPDAKENVFEEPGTVPDGAGSEHATYTPDNQNVHAEKENVKESDVNHTEAHTGAHVRNESEGEDKRDNTEIEIDQPTSSTRDAMSPEDKLKVADAIINTSPLVLQSSNHSLVSHNSNNTS